MLRIRIKMGPHQELQRKVWLCFFGMHVHTATIIIGLWHLFWNILALGIPTIIRRSKAIQNHHGTYYTNLDMNAPALPTPLSNVNSLYRETFFQETISQNSLVTFCMLSITLTMIYGAMKGKPSHLLPFFCVQVLDFAVNALMPNDYARTSHPIQILMSDTAYTTMKTHLAIPWDRVYVILMLTFVTIVMLKAYTISIVWRCYKYLILRQQCMRSILPLGLAELAATNGNGRSYSNILPNYDEAVAQYLKQAPPPSYQVAMSNFLNQQEQHHQPVANHLANVNSAADGNHNGAAAAAAAAGGVILTVTENAATLAPHPNAGVNQANTASNVAEQPPNYSDGSVGENNQESKTPITNVSEERHEEVSSSSPSSPSNVTNSNKSPV